MSSIENNKAPLFEMHRALVILWSEKIQEILDALDAKNKWNNLSLIDYRNRDIKAFREAINYLQLDTNFLQVFTKEFNRIKADIEKIKP